MRNWSKYHHWSPGQIVYPNSQMAIQRIVHSAIQQKKKIRVIGSGHSFNPLWTTKDILMSLDHYQGLIDIDNKNKEATFKAGTKLDKLTNILHQYGLALENLGDINKQSIAGAISTGTHGTGTEFQTMSSQVVSLKLINGQGEIISCSRLHNPELFKCAQISLGALGVIIEVTLKCVSQFKLELIIDKARLDQILDTIAKYNTANRNFEFYWFPNTDRVMTKISNRTDDPPEHNTLSRFFQEYLLENVSFKLICEYGNIFPKQANAISRFSSRTISKVRKVNYSHRVFATPRLVRFNELEYNVPNEAFQDVVKDIIQWIQSNNRTVHFPIEHRFVKSDDIYLSPAYQRDSAYIACHVYYKKKFNTYFDGLEKIFLKYDGRPHWGKIHSLKTNDLVKKYPRFSDFIKIMEEQDPHQIFLNKYLTEIFYGE